MARKNRVTVPDGIYHVTARVAHRAMLFKDPQVKDRIVEWILGIAFFSGVNLFAYCVMDNHIHVFFNVPRVPERLWLDPNVEPAAYAFGMRPCECRAPCWLPPSAGDTPPSLLAALPRPPVGFMLDDGEMAGRLAALYSPETANEIAERWSRMRRDGRGAAVDEEKERYCRRMYNLSQFVKTLSERIASRYNAEFKHEGCVWQGRFYSGVVERALPVLAVVAAYVEYNPVKAGIAATPDAWGHNSFSAACHDEGPVGDAARAGYERLFGCPWEEARVRMEAIFGDSLPEGLTPESLKATYDDYDESRATGSRGEVRTSACGDAGRATETGRGEKGSRAKAPKPRIRASQAIRAGMWFFRKGGYIGRDMAFGERVVSLLPRDFPHVGFKSIRRCRAFEWVLPEPSAKAA